MTSHASASSFVASVVVLPGLLVLWDRYVGESTAIDEGDEAVASTD